MSRRLLVGVFEREQDTLTAIRTSRERGYKVVDVYGPYAVHGVDEAMALSPSRIPWVVFLLGLIGAGLKVWFEFWTTSIDWPVNVGGKPFNSLPAFVPVTFEVMVLFAGVGAVISLFIASKLWPGKKAKMPVAGVTDNRFAVVLEQSDSTFDVGHVRRMFEDMNAVAVEERAEGEV